jgi:acyl-coenzyme A thioesterase PaaI-like protein
MLNADAMTDDLIEEQLPEIPQGYERMNWFQGFGRVIGPLYERIQPDGNYTRAFLVSEQHTNGMRNCHGGMLMAFADMAFGHVISLRTHRYWVTVRLVTDFIAAAKMGDWVEGTADIVGEEDDLYTVRGRVWCGDQTLMTGTGVFKALGQRPVKAHWPKAASR